MKQGKRKDSSAQPNAQAGVEAQELPDAAYVDQLLADSAPATSIDTVAASSAPPPGEQEVAGVIDLPAQCLLRDAAEYRQRLLKCVNATSVVIDVGAVERIDTAFVQVLLAFARSRNDASQSIVWRRVNPEFAEAVRLVGLQSELSVPDVSDAA
jgi:anti-anti-sigma regulatory factor